MFLSLNQTRAHRYFQDLYKYADADVIIVGSGSAGLACAYELSKHPDVKVAVSANDKPPFHFPRLCEFNPPNPTRRPDARDRSSPIAGSGPPTSFRISCFRLADTWNRPSLKCFGD